MISDKLKTRWLQQHASRCSRRCDFRKVRDRQVQASEPVSLCSKNSARQLRERQVGTRQKRVQDLAEENSSGSVPPPDSLSSSLRHDRRETFATMQVTAVSQPENAGKIDQKGKGRRKARGPRLDRVPDKHKPGLMFFFLPRARYFGHVSLELAAERKSMAKKDRLASSDICNRKYRACRPTALRLARSQSVFEARSRPIRVVSSCAFLD